MAIGANEMFEIEVQAHSGSQLVLNNLFYHNIGTEEPLSAFLDAFITLWRAVTLLLNQAYTLDQYVAKKLGSTIITVPGGGAPDRVTRTLTEVVYATGNGTTDNGGEAAEGVPLFASLNCRKLLGTFYDRTHTPTTATHLGRASMHLSPISEGDIDTDGITLVNANRIAFDTAITGLLTIEPGGGGEAVMAVINDIRNKTAVPVAGTGANSIKWWQVTDWNIRKLVGSQLTRKQSNQFA